MNNKNSNQNIGSEPESGQEKFRFIASEVTSDGAIIEMLYDAEDKKTTLAICKDNSLEIRKTYKAGEMVLKPYPPTKDLLKSNVILFPSEPVEYDSQSSLINTIQAFIHKYISVSPSFEKIASYYVLFSWIHDDFNELPYLRGLGGFGTGKSRLLQVIGSICYRPIFANGATTVSPIFRILNDFRGTLVLDEADFQFSDTTTDIVKILNSGFMKGSPVLRSEAGHKRNFDVKSYDVFGPKVIATRFLYEDPALESRMITEDMNLNTVRDDISFNMSDGFRKEALQIRNQLLMFRFRTKGNHEINQTHEDRDIEPRLNQIAIPLMSIIEDPETIAEIHNYIRAYNKRILTDRTMDQGYMLLEVICLLLDSGYKTPTVQQITNQYNEESGYADGLKPRKTGYLIRKHLNLRTERTRDGYILTEDNTEKIEVLRKRYGIKRVSDGERVNLVNSPLGKEYNNIPVINQ